MILRMSRIVSVARVVSSLCAFEHSRIPVLYGTVLFEEPALDAAENVEFSASLQMQPGDRSHLAKSEM